MRYYIKLDAAINAVQEHFNEHGFADYHDGQKMLDRIIALPAEDVRENKRGRWLAADFHSVKCSLCEFTVDIMVVDDHVLQHMNFCPHCGSDMRRPEP